MTIKRVITLEADTDENLDIGLRAVRSLIHNGEPDGAVTSSLAKCKFTFSTEYSDESPRPVEAQTDRKSIAEWLYEFAVTQKQQNRPVIARDMETGAGWIEENDDEAAWHSLHSALMMMSRLKYRTAYYELSTKLQEWFPAQMRDHEETKRRTASSHQRVSQDPTQELEDIRLTIADEIPQASQQLKRGLVEWRQENEEEGKRFLWSAYETFKNYNGPTAMPEIYQQFRRAMKVIFPKEIRKERGA